MLNQVATNQTEETMTSTQLSEMLKIEKKEVNRKIREMFEAEITSGSIPPVMSRYGGVADYHLNELYSTMFVGKWHKPFLKQLAQFWIDGRKPVQPQLPPSELQLTKDIIDSAAKFGMSEAGLLAILGKEIPTDRNHHVIRTESSAERKRPVMRPESGADHSHPGFRTASARALALSGEYVDTDIERGIRVRATQAARELCELMDCLDEDGFMIQRS